MLITVPTVIVVLLFCEVMFRTILPATDPHPAHDFDENYKLIKFEPYQRGTKRVGFPPEIEASFNINSDGWNAPFDYQKERSEKLRIAVIGDSYVAAFEVEPDEAFPHVLDRKLNTNGYDVEVYRFGMSGAPMSQYVVIHQYVLETFKPDLCIISLIHNDFYLSLYGRGQSIYNRYRYEEDGDITLVAAEPPERNRLRKTLQQSALVRLLYTQMNLRGRFLWLRTLFRQDQFDRYDQNVDLSSLNDESLLAEVTDHMFRKFKEQADQHNSDLLLTIDGPRRAIYEDPDPKAAEIYLLNTLAINAAENQGIKIIDLTDLFIEDFAQNRQIFEFHIDNHWNARTHRIVGEMLADQVAPRLRQNSNSTRQ